MWNSRPMKITRTIDKDVLAKAAPLPWAMQDGVIVDRDGIEVDFSTEPDQYGHAGEPEQVAANQIVKAASK